MSDQPTTAARPCSSCGRVRAECRTSDNPFLSCCTTCAANDGDTHQPTTTAALEVARRMEVEMPWTVAAPESWWEVSGEYGKGHRFTACLARVIPRQYHGENIVLFEVMVFGSPFPVAASAITKGRELIFVEADDPNRAYYQRDQALVDRARQVAS